MYIYVNQLSVSVSVELGCNCNYFVVRACIHRKRCKWILINDDDDDDDDDDIIIIIILSKHNEKRSMNCPITFHATTTTKTKTDHAPPQAFLTTQNFRLLPQKCHHHR